MSCCSRINRHYRQPGICLAVAVLVLGALLASAVRSEPAGTFDITLPKQRLLAPAFQLPDLAASRVSLEDFRGKVVLVHFWATFCVPCLHEMPVLESLWQQYRDQGLVILGIAADRGSVVVVRDFTAKNGLTFPVLHDADGTVRNRYEVVALPMSYIVGRDGRIFGRMIGTRDWASPEGHRIIGDLLESGASL
jgi:cytochrome c biogenesis protein CcmG/thiol:disulfide interchange protein DsbE